jgi:hypothetical protein
MSKTTITIQKQQIIRFGTRVLISDVFVSGDKIWATLGYSKVELEVYDQSKPEKGYTVTKVVAQDK